MYIKPRIHVTMQDYNYMYTAMHVRCSLPLTPLGEGTSFGEP
mgnify:CR=1 FL=1